MLLEKAESVVTVGSHGRNAAKAVQLALSQEREAGKDRRGRAARGRPSRQREGPLPPKVSVNTRSTVATIETYTTPRSAKASTDDFKCPLFLLFFPPSFSLLSYSSRESETRNLQTLLSNLQDEDVSSPPVPTYITRSAAATYCHEFRRHRR